MFGKKLVAVKKPAAAPRQFTTKVGAPRLGPARGGAHAACSGRGCARSAVMSGSRLAWFTLGRR